MGDSNMDEREVDKRGEGQTKTTENTKGLAKRSFLTACIIFSLALTIRFIYLYESSANPSFQSPIVDSEFYNEAARKFAAGQGLGSTFFWQPFFYQFFLSVVYVFSGNSIITAKIVQALLSGLTCALVYRLGEKIFDRQTGIIAGLITAFYGPLFFYESELLAAGWAAFWSVVLVLLFLKTQEKDKIRHWFLLGLCGSLSIITRPTFLPFFIAGCIWLRFKVRPGVSLVTRFGALFAGILLVIMPVGFAAKHAGQKFSILPSSGGINLYIGNNPNYRQTLTERPSKDWEEKLFKNLSKDKISRDAWERDRFFKQQVIKYVKSQPLDFAKGLGRKTLEFICSREIPRNVSVYMFGRWSRLLRLLTWKIDGFGFPFGLIFPLVVLGVIFNWRRIPGPVVLFIVLYPSTVILFFVTSRYKVPVVPVFAIPAAAGAVSVAGRIRLKRWKELVLIAAIVAGVVILSTLPGPFCQEQVDFEQEFYQLVGHAMIRQGLGNRAMECLSKAIQLKPDCPETYYYAGNALVQQNKLDEAIKYYTDALRLKPDYPNAHANLGVALMGLVFLNAEHIERGKVVAEAIEHYKEAVRLKPDYPEAHYFWGIALELQDKMDEAILHYREALRLKPDFPEVRKNLASALEKQRKSKDAFKHSLP